MRKLFKNVIILLVILFACGGVSSSVYAGEGSVYYTSSDIGSRTISSLYLRLPSRDEEGGSLSMKVDNIAKTVEFITHAYIINNGGDNYSGYFTATITVMDNSNNTYIFEDKELVARANLDGVTRADSATFNFVNGRSYTISYRTWCNAERDSGSFTINIPANNDSVTVKEIHSQKIIFDVKLQKDQNNSTGATKTIKRTRVSDGATATLSFDPLVIGTRVEGNFVIYTVQVSGLEPDTRYKFEFIRQYFRSNNINFTKIITATETTGPPPMDIAAQEAKKARQILDGTDNPNVKLANTFFNNKSSAQWAYEATQNTEGIKNKIETIETKIINLENKDEIPPTITYARWFNNKSVTTNTIVTLYVDVIDNKTQQNNLKYQYSVNGGSFTPLANYTNQISVNLGSEKGLKIVSVRFIDENNNSVSVEKSIWKL